MDIKKISEKEVRITLNKMDIEEKNIYVIDVLKGSSLAKKALNDFIYEAIENVDLKIGKNKFLSLDIPYASEDSVEFALTVRDMSDYSKLEALKTKGIEQSNKINKLKQLTNQTQILEFFKNNNSQWEKNLKSFDYDIKEFWQLLIKPEGELFERANKFNKPEDDFTTWFNRIKEDFIKGEDYIKTSLFSNDYKMNSFMRAKLLGANNFGFVNADNDWHNVYYWEMNTENKDHWEISTLCSVKKDLVNGTDILGAENFKTPVTMLLIKDRNFFYLGPCFIKETTPCNLENDDFKFIKMILIGEYYS